jgi:dienelactone hydrolase
MAAHIGGNQPVAAARAAILLCALAGLSCAAPADGQIRREVTLATYATHSSNAELVRRLLSPLAALQLQRDLARSGGTLAGQPLNVADEKFMVYVPPQHPAAGFGLVVFIPPWQDARLPPGWASVLDRYGTIFVSAARSGNDESVRGRREPLALLAADNMIVDYPIDPEHVYVAGFSGGSRIALRLALGYPDLFRGAILNAGSDPIGDRDIPLPPRELFLNFQDSTHLVYVTGAEDTDHANADMVSLNSMHHWCVFNTDIQPEPRAGHAVAGAAALARALATLRDNRPPEARKLAACRSAIESELAAELGKAQARLERGERGGAEKLLDKIDERFGGLAAPRSTELAAQLH